MTVVMLVTPAIVRFVKPGTRQHSRSGKVLQPGPGYQPDTAGVGDTDLAGREPAEFVVDGVDESNGLCGHLLLPWREETKASKLPVEILFSIRREPDGSNTASCDSLS